MAWRLRSPALPPAVGFPLGVVGALSVLTFGVLVLRYAGTGSPGRVDQWALDAMGGTLFAPSASRTFAFLIDRCGEPDGAVILVGLLVALCLAARKGRLALLAVAGPGVTVLAGWALKPLVARTVSTGDLAFPSGHTAFLTAVAIVFGLLVVEVFHLGRQAGVLAVGCCAVVAGAAMFWAQTVLFKHYATDTLGGFLLALVLVPAIAWALDRFADRVIIS